MTPSASISASSITEHQRQQLRDLNNEHRDTLEALNQQNYHRKRRAILSNGHDHDE